MQAAKRIANIRLTSSYLYYIERISSEKHVITVYNRQLRRREIVLRIQKNYRGVSETPGEELLCDRAGAVYHADTESTGRDASGKRNPEY